ncbi:MULTISPECIES: putative toxin-antitoxin system toxin component, PIN family [Actinomyces]|uniref:PIN domain-containing protein n=1 Tax=Actinomyces TaxID=1654 RepID=UPI000DCB1600|nr:MULTISPECIES: PIN domain-containing protein [Actinomyces]MBE6474848.1 PIN domain-containing protein [Actinomyces succiniciruminis]RAX24147.1 PIN domain-containing protein [Actinomyces sp. Z3]
MTQRVLVDANVLFQKTTMDWLFLLRLHNQGMFQIYATEDILAEVIANMREKKPRMPGHVTRRRAELIRKSLDEVIPDYPGNVPFSGADPKDYHVHAAAVFGQADFLLTHNDSRDFTDNPDGESYSVIAPDEFFLLIANSAPNCMMPIVRKQMEYWMDRPGYRQLDDALMRSGCPGFAQCVREVLQQIALL